MKTKLLLWSMLTIAAVFPARAQTVVTVDATSNWNGFANVFFNGAYQFGSSWTLADLKSVINTSTNSVELYPNFNTYNASDPYWSNGELGNKTFEGNTFVESTTFAGQTLTFTASVSSNTFAAGYDVRAFIKGLNPANNYATDVYVYTPLVSGETFSITAPNIPAGLIVQYGFSVSGLNGNPAHAATLGSAEVTGVSLATHQLESDQVSVYPNPANGIFNISSGKNISEINVYNTIGQKVWSAQQPNTIDISTLESGLYIAEIKAEGRTSSVKLQKK